jgi:hypothetical protein
MHNPQTHTQTHIHELTNMHFERNCMKSTGGRQSDIINLGQLRLLNRF